MDITIYAQALKKDVPGDLFYKDRYIDKNSDEKIKLSDFFTNVEILNYSKVKDLEKVKSGSKISKKYLYLDVPCIEKDDIGRYSPIIIQAYHKDVDKIFEALDEFLEKSNRHITEESRNAIKEKIDAFKKKIEKIDAFNKNVKKVVCCTLAALGVKYLLTKKKK